jgi:hypothetical protein
VFSRVCTTNAADYSVIGKRSAKLAGDNMDAVEVVRRFEFLCIIIYVVDFKKVLVVSGGAAQIIF